MCVSTLPLAAVCKLTEFAFKSITGHAVKHLLGIKDTLNLSFSKYQHHMINVAIFNYGIKSVHKY